MTAPLRQGPTRGRVGPALLLLGAASLHAVARAGGVAPAAHRIRTHLSRLLGVSLHGSLEASAPRPSEAPSSPPAASQPHAEDAYVLGDALSSVGPLSSIRPALHPIADRLGRGLGGGRIVTGSTRHRLLLLTFDDGPGLRSTERVLQVLATHRLHATFFLTTSWLAPGTPRWQRRRAMARRIAAQGHLLGAHGFEHVQLPMLRNAAIEEQLNRAEAIFRDVLGGPPRLFRPPGGARSARTDRLVERRGWTQILWNLGTGDTQSHTPDTIVRTFWRVLARREAEHGDRGGIVLMHDIHSWSAEALRRLLVSVQERNCTLWRTGEELYDLPPPAEALRWFVQPRSSGRFGDLAPPASPPSTWLAARQAHLRHRLARRCGPPSLGPLARR